MRRRGVLFHAWLAMVALCAGCSSAGVEISRSDQRRTDPAPADTTDPIDTTSTTDPSSTTGPSSPPTSGVDPPSDGLPVIAPVVWSPCESPPAPWECGSIEVPLDYGEPAGRQITIALTRLPALDSPRRIGSLVLNPGGPGGSGLVIVYNEADSFPQPILERFDIVGFDPRGVGASTAVECPPGFDSALDVFDECIDLSGEILPYLGTPNAARDLEMTRRALQDDKLSYLGYSYGTALGAVYADMFPDRIRSLVLDGAIDPDAGLSNIDGQGGYDFYAQQDFDGTLDVFHTLCDATSECDAGPDSRDLLDRVYDDVETTPAEYFGDGESIAEDDVDDVIFSSMYSAFNWAILGIALRDADDGEASTLKAMSSWLQFGYPADMESEPNYDFANLAIRCADFASRDSDAFECEDFPDSAEPLPVITEVDASVPIVVIGTKDDPATPGRYADQLADALGDAVDITWDGAGHTAFLSSSCINDIVVAYLIDQIVPRDGQTCPFVSSAKTVQERADAIFESLDADAAVEVIEPLLAASGVPEQISDCVARFIVSQGTERLIVHQLLGVDSPEIIALRSAAAMRCGPGG